MKPVTLVTALLATSALGVVGFEIAADRVAREAVHTVIANHRGLGVAAIEARPLAGRIVLRGVTIESGATRVMVGTLDLPLARFPFTRPGFSLVSRAEASPFEDKPAESPAPATQPTTPSPVPSASSMGNASASDVVITSGATIYRIKRIDLTGTRLSDADVTALLDAKNAEPLPARLKRLSAAAIVVPEILIDDPTAGSERHSTVKQVLLANIVAGKVANGSAAGMTFAFKDGNGAVNGAFGSITAAGLDVAQIAHVFGTLRTDEAEPILPLYDSVAVDTIKITNVTRNATISVAFLKETGAKGRALKTDLQAFSAEAAQASGQTGTTDEKSAAFFNDVVHSFAVQSLEAGDISAENDEATGKNMFGASTFALHGFSNGHIDEFGMQAFHFDGPDTSITLGATAFKGLTVPSAGQGGKAPPFNGTITLDQVAVKTVLPSATPDTETPPPPTPIKFKIGHLDLASDAAEPGAIPPKSAMNLRHLVFDLLPASDTTRPLYDMGYRHLDLSADLASTYDKTNLTLDIGKLSVEGDGMGTIGLGLTFLNVGNGLISQSPEIAKASAFAMLIKRVDVNVTNAGLFDKALAWKAKNDAVTVDAERATGIEYFGTTLPAGLGGGANIKMLGAAIAKFIAEPRTLHVTAASKNGIGAADMGLIATPDVLLNSLDMTAAADR